MDQQENDAIMQRLHAFRARHLHQRAEDDPTLMRLTEALGMDRAARQMDSRDLVYVVGAVEARMLRYDANGREA